MKPGICLASQGGSSMRLKIGTPVRYKMPGPLFDYSGKILGYDREDYDTNNPWVFVSFSTRPNGTSIGKSGYRQHCPLSYLEEV